MKIEWVCHLLKVGCTPKQNIDCIAKWVDHFIHVNLTDIKKVSL
jgi:hypothetical protein